MESSRDHIWRYARADDYLNAVREGLPPIIICCAINGGIQGKEYNEAIPETPDEIADAAHAAYEAGASMIHVHARSPETRWKGATTMETWREVNRKIRERCPDAIINNTTGADFYVGMGDRLSCLDAKPEVASLNLSPDMSEFKLKERTSPLEHPRQEIHIDETIPFTFGQIRDFAQAMKERGIKPELETYHTGAAGVVRHLIDQELIEPPYWIQTVMGYQASSLPTVDNVVHLLRELPDGALWLCSGIGRHQLPMTTLATLMGGHVRVGLEDNIYYRRGEKATNAKLVERAVRVALELNREVATPEQARAMLGLSPTPTQYS
jgi:3-keto-5-aminohexanoate cleavage enzyme